ISVPIAAAVVWLIVVKGSYKSVEKVFLTASFFYIAYIIAGVLAHPNWKAAAVSALKPPTSTAVFRIPGYAFMVTGIIGAPSLRGCSFTCRPPWWRRELRSATIKPRESIFLLAPSSRLLWLRSSSLLVQRL